MGILLLLLALIYMHISIYAYGICIHTHIVHILECAREHILRGGSCLLLCYCYCYGCCLVYSFFHSVIIWTSTHSYMLYTRITYDCCSYCHCLMSTHQALVCLLLAFINSDTITDQQFKNFCRNFIKFF